jgi:hypothetical protein
VCNLPERFLFEWKELKMTRLLPIVALLGLLIGCAPAPYYSDHRSGYSTYPRHYGPPTPVCHYTSYYDRYQRRHVTVRRCH